MSRLRWTGVVLLALLGALPVRAGRIHDAVRRGHPGIVRACISAGTKVDVRDGDQRTPLYLAAYYDRPAIARLLLSRGASIHLRDHEAVPILCRARSVEMIRLLLDSGCDAGSVDPRNGRSLVQDAVRRGDEEAARLLLRRGAPVDHADYRGWTPLHEAVARAPSGPGGVNHMAELLLTAGAEPARFDPRHPETPLHLAVERDQRRLVEVMLRRRPDLEVRDGRARTVLHRARTPEMMNLLLGAGAEVNAVGEDGRTVLFRWLRDRRTVELLLGWGADPMVRDTVGRTVLEHAREVCPGCRRVHRLLAVKPGAEPAERLPPPTPVREGPPRDSYGWTELHRACEGSSPERVAELLAAGIGPEERTGSGLTALHVAARGGRLEVVRLLLDGGADPDARDGTGETALHAAARVGHRAVLEELLGRGADPAVRTDRGARAADLAARYGHAGLARLLAPPEEEP